MKYKQMMYLLLMTVFFLLCILEVTLGIYSILCGYFVGLATYHYYSNEPHKKENKPDDKE